MTIYKPTLPLVTATLILGLEAMMEGGVYADFVLLYLLIHRSRLPHGQRDATDCWLERWRDAAVQGGTRALDALRGGVTSALKALGQGLLEHPANDRLRARLEGDELTVPEYYRQLLRLVYRFLFLLVAEERDLLFAPDVTPRLRAIYMMGYSVTRLRDRADRRRREDQHDDLWRSLAVTVGMMREGCPGLALEPLSGGLFNERSCPDLDAAQLANSTLLEALRGLSLVTVKGVRRRVNYRDLNVEELGSVYESLLDLHPALRREGRMPRFELVEGSERKTTGSYYTPPQLVAELIKSALEPVIARARGQGRTPDEKRRNLLSLRVCDPAAGSGHFLLAAARRIGRDVARVDAGETEPDIETLRRAVREVIQRCIYGMDVNPLAVDLCRLALWIEGHLPGRPLTFLDHRVKCGNSLVGATPDTLEAGIPNEAFAPLTGDDKGISRDLVKRNKGDHKRDPHQLTLRFMTESMDTASDAEVRQARVLLVLPEERVDEIDAKAAAYAAFDELMERKRAVADIWAAAFFWTLRPSDPLPPTQANLQALRLGGEHLTLFTSLSAAQQARIRELVAAHHIFHWHLEFPEVFGESGEGGFDCILGNPPWERIKLQEQEFFAARSPAIALAPNANARRQLIAALPQIDPALWQTFTEAKHAAEGQSKFARESRRFPLTAVGDVNLYALFAEQFRSLVGGHGRAGLICPTGIATDDSMKQFFGDLVQTKALVSFFGFKNEQFLFSRPVEHTVTFGLLTLVGRRQQATEMEFTWLAYNTTHMNDPKRRHVLTADEIALVNPNTRTCPVFRTRADAELTKAIYRRVPVLVDEQRGAIPWGVRFMTMFHMSNDSGMFRTRDQLEAEGWALDSNVFRRGNEACLPLYEAKLLHQYDHRWATYDGVETRDLTPAEKTNPYRSAMPRYWVPHDQIDARLADRWGRNWLLGFRDIARNTDERTAIFSLLPRVGAGNKIPLLTLTNDDSQLTACLLASLDCMVHDYCVRQKVGGTTLNFFLVKQFPILPPSTYAAGDMEYIVPRVLELVYTAWDMQPFAQDLGYKGPPFTWDDEQRARLLAELDAYYARLYGLTRKQLRYILDPHDLTDHELEDILDPAEDPPDAPRTKDFPGETFRVLKEREVRQYGEYRTKRLVLDAWEKLHCSDITLQFGVAASM